MFAESPRRITALDGVRGLACIMVVFYHSFPHIAHLPLGSAGSRLAALTGFGIMLHHIVMRTSFYLMRHKVASIEGASDLIPALLAIPITMGICQILWIYFERPFVNIGHKYKYLIRERATAAVIG